jgi:hypothetical protein
MWDMGI